MEDHIDPEELDIAYQTTAEGITPGQLEGFFVGWPNPPDAETHLRILENSTHIVIAIDQERIVGFISAISDGVTAAYIPNLEVLPAYQGRGIGSELIRRLLDDLKGIYAIDLMCDADVVPFYERLGFRQGIGMMIRNYDNQQGLPPPSP